MGIASIWILFKVIIFKVVILKLGGMSINVEAERSQSVQCLEVKKAMGVQQEGPGGREDIKYTSLLQTNSAPNQRDGSLFLFLELTVIPNLHGDYQSLHLVLSLPIPFSKRRWRYFKLPFYKLLGCYFCLLSSLM